MHLSYVDEEGDTCAIINNRDLKLAFRGAFKTQSAAKEGGLPIDSLRFNLGSSRTQSFAATLSSTPKHSDRLPWQKGQLLGKGGFGKVYKA